MLNKFELFAMDSKQVFEAILNGKISFEQFDDWHQRVIEDHRSDAYDMGHDDGHRIGYDTGYESAQEAYGDGPSS